MERDTTHDVRPDQISVQPQLTRATGENRLDAPRAENIRTQSRAQTGLDDARECALIQFRGRYIRVNTSALTALRDIGRFRTVAVEDLVAFRYGGDQRRLEQDLDTMAAQGLLSHRLWRSPRVAPLPILVLTKTGRDALAAHDAGRAQDATRVSQRHYAGFVKPREVRHDAAIYRMFQAEERRLVKEGSRVLRIVLDYELKACIYAPLAKARALPKPEFHRLQQAVAHAHGLRVVDGKIPLPDLRIEYETASGERQSVDLELATGHYHGGAMATKARAGFRFYVADGSAAKLSRVMEERDITVAILSL